jgi:hypothetical protein
MKSPFYAFLRFKNVRRQQKFIFVQDIRDASFGCLNLRDFGASDIFNFRGSDVRVKIIVKS